MKQITLKLIGELLNDSQQKDSKIASILENLSIELTEYAHGNILIAAGANQILPMNGVENAKAVILITDAECSYMLNGGTEETPLTSWAVLTAGVNPGYQITEVKIKAKLAPIGGTNVTFIIVG